MLQYIILGTLLEKPLSGYDIRKKIQDGVGMFYKASYGSIYPLLSKLESDCLISENKETNASVSSDHPRKKKEYQLTEQGRVTFLTWLKDESIGLEQMELFMTKVFFFDKLPRRDAERQLDVYEKKLKDYLISLEAERSIYDALPDQHLFYYKLSTLYYGIAKLHSMLDWCQYVRSGKPLQNMF